MLKAILNSLDGIDENLASLYAEQDGKYFLQVESAEGYALENVQGLKSSLQKERNTAKALTKQLGIFDGLDAEEARTAIDQLSLGNSKNAEETKTQIEALKAQLGKKHAEEMDGLTASLDSMRGQMSQELVKSKAIEALAKFGGNADLLMPHIMNQTRLEEADGKYSAIVIDKNGDARISSKANTMDNMTIEELVTTMRDSDTFAPAFTGSGATGSGSTGSTASGGSKGNIVLTYDEAKNANTYREAQARADKAGSQVQILDPNQ
jgi:hypothetical protein